MHSKGHWKGASGSAIGSFPTLFLDLGSMVDDAEFADVTFVVEGKKVYAHRAMLVGQQLCSQRSASNATQAMKCDAIQSDAIRLRRISWYLNSTHTHVHTHVPPLPPLSRSPLSPRLLGAIISAQCSPPG